MSTHELDQKQEKKVDLFTFLSDIGHKKQYLYDEDTQSSYNQFMVNRAFMQHIDTVLLANEMNKNSGISNEMHHDFLFFSIDAKPRYGKWAKKKEEQLDVVDHIKTKYSVGHERALEYINLMTEEQIKNIEQSLKRKGGKL